VHHCGQYGREEATVAGAWSFDPVVLGRQECAAWIAYYRRDWRAFLPASVRLVREGFGMDRRRSLVGAWLVLRANMAWAPYPDNDPEAARELMHRFYLLAAEHAYLILDPDEAARREVGWWRVHRDHQHHKGPSESDLTGALQHLYSYVYRVSEESVERAARNRVLAMRSSDQWVSNGCDLADPLLAQERRELVASYTALRNAIDRSANTRSPS
jgi:hypothetical protein